MATVFGDPAILASQPQGQLTSFGNAQYTDGNGKKWKQIRLTSNEPPIWMSEDDPNFGDWSPTTTGTTDIIPGLTGQPQTGGFDLSQLLAMSDEDLFAFAGQLGVDTSPFSLTEFGGSLGAPQITMSPEVRAEVANIFNAQREKGNEELSRFAITAAGRRGLNLTDTPIFDPLLRQKAAFESQLGGQESAAVLGLNESMRNFLENIRQFQTEQGRLGENSQRSFLQNIFSTQEALAQHAFANRLQLAQQSGQLGSNLSGQRLGMGTGSTTVAPPNFGAGIQGIGAAFQNLFGQPQQGFIPNPNFVSGSNNQFIFGPIPGSGGLFS